MRPLPVLLLVLTLAGCSLNRPGEVSPRELPGCAALEAQTRVTPAQDLTDEQLQQMIYCNTAAAAEAARATETHTDFQADLSYLSILISLVATVITVAAQVD